ncbi:hypothetical protein DPMN_060304 [Dreissena polymorpha]|uniref:Uncharacterized protein n=1 Tax=Dreissena polymorpha TaxID=45954 RepID=A0A9D4HHD4_DREPO|nr:hypothetical protein DPMN_060304 [Dreissena polymorpha]
MSRSSNSNDEKKHDRSSFIINRSKQEHRNVKASEKAQLDVDNIIMMTNHHHNHHSHFCNYSKHDADYCHDDSKNKT